MALIIAISAGSFFCLHNFSTDQQITYKTSVILKGNVQNTISSTGTLNPVSTIEVGTQVSGTVDKVYIDYNDIVKKNQVIAEIDRQPLLIRLSQAKSACLRTEALFEQAKLDYERNIPLHEKGIITDEEFVAAKTNFLSQKASLESAKSDVETAQTNLGYATIRSPVNGTVIGKSVEAGQTVAASLSAPTLFKIAEDLHKMEILADVDESDIGRITTGQEVEFNVPAYPDRTYSGSVNQIRLQPTTSQSVVTYTVVISADNNDGSLLPGMTANVEFISEKADSVLLVPTTALKFKPSDKEMIKNRPKRDETSHHGNSNGGHRPESSAAVNQPPMSGPDNSFNRSGSDSNHRGNALNGQNRRHSDMESRGVIWILTNDNQLKPEFVKTGISDGSNIEISGRNISEGIKVVTGTIAKKKNVKESKSLFGPQKRNNSSKTSDSGKKSGGSNMPPPPGGF